MGSDYRSAAIRIAQGAYAGHSLTQGKAVSLARKIEGLVERALDERTRERDEVQGFFLEAVERQKRAEAEQDEALSVLSDYQQDSAALRHAEGRCLDAGFGSEVSVSDVVDGLVRERDEAQGALQAMTVERDRVLAALAVAREEGYRLGVTDSLGEVPDYTDGYSLAYLRSEIEDSIRVLLDRDKNPDGPWVPVEDS